MKHTTLKTVLGFDDRDIHRLSTTPNGNTIDYNSVPTFILGTIINSIESTYSNTAIFNLKNLQDIGLLDLNPQSAAHDDLSILMTSNKDAAVSSNAVSAEVKASANLAGIIGASAAASYEQSLSLANSDGYVYVSMQRGKHGSYYEINTRDLEAGYDFTPYLIGEELDATEVERYITYREKSVGDERYISELVFGGYEDSGLIRWSERNIYGNIQLLTRMEEFFALLLKQHVLFEHDPEVQVILYENMTELKNKISHAVRDFYAHVGTHFVKKLHFSNFVYGYGTLEFDESSGNQESRVGVAASLGGGIPSKLSVEAGASASFAKANGWASEMKNLNIQAQSKPSGIVDISAFADKIRGILDAEGNKLSVPSLTIPVKAEVELLGKPAVEKKHLGPPDSVFSSYSDWKEYQEDIKKDKGGHDKVDASINKINKDVEKESTRVLLDEEARETGEAAEVSKATNLYREYVHELKALRTQDGPPTDNSFATSGNLLRIENMFVSGYETESYEAVIPSLRTSKIALPEKAGEIDVYANATRILLVISLFRQLADYATFMSNFTISNISEQLATNIDRFYGYFSQKGYKLVTDSMSSGTDVDAALMHDFALDMYGDHESLLYQTLGSDVDEFDYVQYLLTPEVMHLWRDAPGGYAPFFFETDGSVTFAGSKEIITTKERTPIPGHVGKVRYYYDLETSIKDTPDVTKLYADYPESPYYPVFRYEAKNRSKLLFLQLLGRYQLIFGKSGMIQPYMGGNEPTLPLTTDSISSKAIVDIDDSVIDALIGHIEGFDVDQINNDYALYFPEKTQSKRLREDNRVSMLSFNWNEEFSQAYTAVHLSEEGIIWGVVYQDIVTSLSHYGSKNIGTVVKVEDGSKLSVEGFPVLFPIDYSRIAGGYGSLLMGSAFGASNFIGSPTYDAAVITSMHD